MPETDLHEAFSALLIDEPPLPDFLAVALAVGRRRRRRRSAGIVSGCAVLAALVVLVGLGVSAARQRSAGAISPVVTSQLLVIADRAAAACGGPAEHVQVASSTREVANIATTGGRGMDNRPVWVLLITGGPFQCQHSGPSNAPLPPAKDILIILDQNTLETTDGGFGDHESLSGLGPVTNLR